MTQTIRGAATALAELGKQVAGVRNSFGLDDLPEKLTPATHLPCLMIFPVNGGGFRTQGMMGSNAEIRFGLDHYLMVRAYASQLELKDALPKVTDLIDAYVAAVSALPYLAAASAPAVSEATEFTIEPGVTAYADGKFHSIKFSHNLVICAGC